VKKRRIRNPLSKPKGGKFKNGTEENYRGKGESLLDKILMKGGARIGGGTINLERAYYNWKENRKEGTVETICAQTSKRRQGKARR